MVDSLQKATNTEFSNWMRYQTSELIAQKKLAIGDGYRAKNSELCPLKSGLVFARAGNINQGFKFDNADYLAEENLTRAGEKISEEGDVLFTSKGTVGRVAFVSNKTKKFVYSPQLSWWRIRDKNLIEPRFLYYWMFGKEFSLQINSFKGQTDMADCVSLRDQRQMYITIPPLPEQKAIAQILGSLDDKIELNRQMNQTLEAMAKAIFKSWFVDFDPVRAKMERRQPAGMDAATAELFPAEFEESALGAIPKGWGAKPLSEVVNVNPRRILSKGEVAPYLDMASMPTQGHRPENWINRAFGSGTKFVNGDTLLARITPCLENGKSAFVDFLESGQVGWGSTEYIILRPKPPLPVEYGYYLARSDDLREYAIQNMTGSSGRQRVPADCFSKYFITVPSKEVAQAFGNFIKPSMKNITANCEQSRTLASIRDTLLPKLLSGEIRIKEVEEIVGDVI